MSEEESRTSNTNFLLKREVPENIAKETNVKRARTSISDPNANFNIREDYQNVVVTDQPDEFEIFGRSLAAQLRRMPLYDAIVCQEKLQSVITQSRLSSLGTSTFSLQ